MSALLAYANSGDQSLSTMKLILSGCVTLGTLAVVAFIPAVIARRRQARRAGAIVPVAILWAVVTAATVVPFVARYQKWSQDDTRMLMSGYYDPRDQPEQHPAPQIPWPFWSILAGAYIALMLWSGLDAPSRPAANYHESNGDPAP